jgi:CRISPR-associated protein Csx14
MDKCERSNLSIGHWADASSRNNFKLYAGNRSAVTIAPAMLRGTREKTRNGKRGTRREQDTKLKTHGVDSLSNFREKLTANPFGMLTATGGCFNFDP